MLLVIFDADVDKLIPLYAFGVFVSFTLSQGGMVVHWLRLRGAGLAPEHDRQRRRRRRHGRRGDDHRRDEVHRRRLDLHDRDGHPGAVVLAIHGTTPA